MRTAFLADRGGDPAGEKDLPNLLFAVGASALALLFLIPRLNKVIPAG